MPPMINDMHPPRPISLFSLKTEPVSLLKSFSSCLSMSHHISPNPSETCLCCDNVCEMFQMECHIVRIALCVFKVHTISFKALHLEVNDELHYHANASQSLLAYVFKTGE